MKHKKEICCVIIGGIISTILWGYAVFLVPVGSVDGQTIFKYQLNRRLNSSSGSTIKNMGKEIAFANAMRDLKVSVSETDVDKEFNEMVARYGGTKEVENIMLDMMGNTETLRQSVKNGMLKQKAIEHFASNVSAMKSEAEAFYNEHKSDYTDFETEYEKIKADYRMEAGAKEYDKYIEAYEEKITIRIY